MSMSSPPDNARLDAGTIETAAEFYDRVRPSYPVDLLGKCLELAPATAQGAVVDIGAGTGRAAALISQLGYPVVAIERDYDMAGILRRRAVCPVALGSAEKLPLRNAVAPAVVVAQAFHYFDLRRATQEMARILQPEGVAILLWNSSDARVEWVGKAGRLLRTINARKFESYATTGRRSIPYFTEEVRLTRSHHLDISVDDFWRMSIDRPGTRRLPRWRERLIEARVRRLLRKGLHQGRLKLPLVTTAIVLRLRDRAVV